MECMVLWACACVYACIHIYIYINTHTTYIHIHMNVHLCLLVVFIVVASRSNHGLHKFSTPKHMTCSAGFAAFRSCPGLSAESGGCIHWGTRTVTGVYAEVCQKKFGSSVGR